MGPVCILLANPSIFIKTVSSIHNQQELLGLHLKSGSFSYVLGPDTPRDECKKVKWCAIGHHERVKCDEWSINSEGKIECETAESTEDCIAKIAVCHSCLHRAVFLPLLPACP